MPKAFGWLEVDLIGQLLAEHHPEVDPIRTSFTELKKLVAALPDFKEEPGHPVNEKILEHIQQAWIDERNDIQREDD
jgi:FeS assembly protein IscX